MQEERTAGQLVGQRIQALRKKKGYTQSQFAEMIGLSNNYLSDIERGRSFTTLDKLIAIMNTLECSADDLFIDVTKYSYKAKASRLSEQLDKLSPSDRKKALAILEAFINMSE